MPEDTTRCPEWGFCHKQAQVRYLPAPNGAQVRSPQCSLRACSSHPHHRLLLPPLPRDQEEHPRFSRAASDTSVLRALPGPTEAPLSPDPSVLMAQVSDHRQSRTKLTHEKQTEILKPIAPNRLSPFLTSKERQVARLISAEGQRR